MDTKEQIQKDLQDLQKDSQTFLKTALKEIQSDFKRILENEIDKKVSQSILSQTHRLFSSLIIQIAMLAFVTTIFFYISNSNKTELMSNQIALKEDIKSNKAELKEDIQNIKREIKEIKREIEIALRRPASGKEPPTGRTEKYLLDKSIRTPASSGKSKMNKHQRGVVKRK